MDGQVGAGEPELLGFAFAQTLKDDRERPLRNLAAVHLQLWDPESAEGDVGGGRARAWCGVGVALDGGGLELAGVGGGLDGVDGAVGDVEGGAGDADGAVEAFGLRVDVLADDLEGQAAVGVGVEVGVGAGFGEGSAVVAVVGSDAEAEGVDGVGLGFARAVHCDFDVSGLEGFLRVLAAFAEAGASEGDGGDEEVEVVRLGHRAGLVVHHSHGEIVVRVREDAGVGGVFEEGVVGRVVAGGAGHVDLNGINCSTVLIDRGELNVVQAEGFLKDAEPAALRGTADHKSPAPKPDCYLEANRTAIILAVVVGVFAELISKCLIKREWGHGRHLPSSVRRVPTGAAWMRPGNSVHSCAAALKPVQWTGTSRGLPRSRSALMVCVMRYSLAPARCVPPMTLQMGQS